MTTDTPSFDLVEEPWVPVVEAGRPARASLRQLAEAPDHYDGLDVADPLAAVAVLRQVLLPVWIDALGLPRDAAEWSERWEQPRAGSSRVLDYLEEHRSRFDLFSPTAPFGQVPGLSTPGGDTKPVAVLQPDVATGNNVPLFTPLTEASDRVLPPGDAALALLVAQCFDTAAIKSGAAGDPAVRAGKTTGNPTGPLGQQGMVVPLGADLAETLALNTPLETNLRGGVEADEDDAEDDVLLGVPGWRRPPDGPSWATRPVRGLLELLTWQSRRIRLVPERTTHALAVRRVVLTAGDRMLTLPLDEPHCLWRRDKPGKGAEPAPRPVRLRPGRDVWRGLDSLLATDAPTSDQVESSLLLRQAAALRVRGALPATARLRVLTTQVVYGNQSAVVDEVLTDLLPLPLAALPTDSQVREVLLLVCADADGLQRAANRLGDEIRQASGGDAIAWDQGQRLGDALVADLSPVVRRLLAGLQRHPEQDDAARRAWRQVARRRAADVVEPALRAAPARALAGRALERGGRSWDVRLSTAEARYRAEVSRVLGADVKEEEHA